MQVSARSPLEFRQRRSDDDSFIARLAGRAFSEYDVDAGQNTLRWARAGNTWLAWRADRPVAFAICRLEGAGAELAAIAVEESARGSGVGSALLAHLEGELGSVGMRELTLHTAHANLSALELFLKRGYRIERRLPRYYRGVFDACALRKALRSARG